MKSILSGLNIKVQSQVKGEIVVALLSGGPLTPQLIADPASFKIHTPLPILALYKPLHN